MRTILKNNEKIIYTTTLHWYFLTMPFLTVLIFILLSVYLFLKIDISGYIPLSIIILSLLYLIYKIYDRRLNIWVITNLRLIDEQGVFTVKVKESPIDKINNVSYVQPLLGRMLGFGDVEIQTAAEQGATVYKGLKMPKELSEALTTAQEEYKRNLFNISRPDSSTPNDSPLNDDTIECPYCAERIKAKAKICRFCGREIT